VKSLAFLAFLPFLENLPVGGMLSLYLRLVDSNRVEAWVAVIETLRNNNLTFEKTKLLRFSSGQLDLVSASALIIAQIEQADALWLQFVFLGWKINDSPHNSLNFIVNW